MSLFQCHAIVLSNIKQFHSWLDEITVLVQVLEYLGLGLWRVVARAVTLEGLPIMDYSCQFFHSPLCLAH